ncbi:YbjN domain-containing protein [Portibacter marinus]|uniref:YbjN domain-containing protein n=1 Tax=Portibacter marinus TaxID=2898660 RepID=UPI001F32E1A5|nr:YbjN domain-containing protein [Portibacter marinus]
MGFFDDLFNRSKETGNGREYSLGRFSDAYKPSSYQDIWEQSLLSFENEKYTDSVKLLLEFLLNNEKDNISWKEESEVIRFELLQGSKVVTGLLNDTHFRAEVKIAKTADLNIGLSRKLLERNYLLKFSRFALDENDHILLIFNSYKVDASPNKLYQALKEMATQADKLDDLLIDEFRDLEPINIDHIRPRSEEQKEKQYQYLIKQLEQCFDEIDNGKLNIDQFPGGLSFLLLALNYKLDYLLTPEGFLMDTLEQNHRNYFSNNHGELGRKNNMFIKSFRKILDREKEEIKAEFYDVVSTFGLPSPTPHEVLVQLIDKELGNIQWYKDNNHDAIALAIPGYIVGYSLFSYALPKPDMDLLALFYRITEKDFFTNNAFYKADKLNTKSIKKEIEQIEQEYRNIHPLLEIDPGILDFSNMVNFCETYLIMIKNITLYGEDR